MTWKSRQSNKAGVWQFALARRIGFALGGAVAGTIMAIFGLILLKPPKLAFAFTLAGAGAAFVGASIVPPHVAAARQAPTSGRITVESATLLSAFGTLVTNSSAFVAVWLFIFQVPGEVTWAAVIGFWSLFGVAAQTSGGIFARLPTAAPEIVRAGRAR